MEHENHVSSDLIFRCGTGFELFVSNGNRDCLYTGTIGECEKLKFIGVRIPTNDNFIIIITEKTWE